jgi:hypothetical protein
VGVLRAKCDNLYLWSEYSLGGNKIADVGAISIAESLFGNTTLAGLEFVFYSLQNRYYYLILLS